MANNHVSKQKGSGDWTVKRESAERVSDTARTQQRAEQIAKKLSANSGGGEVRIHGRDGKIRDSDTVAPGSDRNPPRDRRH